MYQNDFGFSDCSSKKYSLEQNLIIFISANRILQALSSVRKTDLKLVMTMERNEIKQGFGTDFSQPATRVFYCPNCSYKKVKVALVDKICEECGFKK